MTEKTSIHKSKFDGAFKKTSVNETNLYRYAQSQLISVGNEYILGILIQRQSLIYNESYEMCDHLYFFRLSISIKTGFLGLIKQKLYELNCNNINVVVYI